MKPKEKPTPHIVLVVEAMLGGVREHVLQLSFGMRRRGWDVTLVVSPDRADPAFHGERGRLEHAGVRVWALPMKRNPIAPANLLACWRLARQLTRVRPDVVHAHAAIAGGVGRAAAWLAGLQAVIYSPHGGSLHETSRPASRLFGMLEKTLATRTQAIILISEWLKSRCAKVVGCSPEKMIVIPIGVEPACFSSNGDPAEREVARNILGITPETTVFLSVGLLRKIKGQDVLIRAFQRIWQRYQNSRLFLVGEGEMRAAWERLACDLGVRSAVQFTGFVNDIHPYHRIADVYVHPTRADASSYSVMEAMAASLPVIASSTAALPEIVEQGQTGMLVPPEDPIALAAAMEMLMDNPSWRQRMGLAGRRRVLAHFSLEGMIQRTEEVYLRCLNRTPEAALAIHSSR